MTFEAIQHILEYADDKQCAVQITFDPTNINGWTADFKSDVHAHVCAEELAVEGFNIHHQRLNWLRRIQ